MRDSSASYRTPMEIVTVRYYPHIKNQLSFPVCPRCGVDIEYDYQKYCYCCGQALGWKNIRYVKSVVIK